MRYVATLTTSEGHRDQKIFDLVGSKKPGEPRHPLPEVFSKITGAMFDEPGQVIITSNEDPKFKLELI